MFESLLHEQRYHLLRLQAEAVFSDSAQANLWLTQPLTILEGKSALAAASTVAGAQQVSEALARIEFGLFA